MPEPLIQVPVGLTTEGLLGCRYVARTIDSTITGALAIGALSRFGPQGSQTAEGLTPVLLSLFALLIFWIGYGAMMESSPWQATLGKKLMGLRVYDSEGGRLSFPQALARNLLKDGPFLLFTAIPGGQLLSFLWLCVHLLVLHRSPVYQAIHDRIAKTWVAAPESTIQLRLN